MHIYFSGIGGAGIGPLAMVSYQAGFSVSGSDKQNSSYLDYLIKHGIKDIHIGQSYSAIAKVHKSEPIDWFVYTSALTLEQAEPEEIAFCKDNGIKISKRDELLNLILKEKDLKLIAIAGTHGKTTTTAMVTWLFIQLGLPISYLLPAKTTYADLGKYDPKSKYFVYEADEFDRNFLAYKPYISLISGVSWDHHEIFPKRSDYTDAFREFIANSETTLLWQEDADYLDIDKDISGKINILDPSSASNVNLLGKYNRRDGWLAIKALAIIENESVKKLTNLLNNFPGLSRRMEQIEDNLYSDYAHTPEKIKGAMSVALETAKAKGQKVIVIYEPLTNRRQHYMLKDYKDCFMGANKVYWLPSYLAREDPAQEILMPSELISHLSDPSIAEAMERDNNLKEVIGNHLKEGDMVVGMAGGGGNSLDDWLRQEFQP